MASQVIVLIAASGALTSSISCLVAVVATCHLPLVFHLPHWQQLSLSFTRRVFLSMQLMASNCGLATAVRCLSCNRLAEPRATSRAGNVATSACSSYFRLPHFVAAAATTPKRASYLAYATHTPRQVTQILRHERSGGSNSMQSSAG